MFSKLSAIKEKWESMNGGVRLLIIIIFVVVLSLLLVGTQNAIHGGGGGSTHKCTICRKAATHEFQGYYYCNEHYQDAILWAGDDVNGKHDD